MTLIVLRNTIFKMINIWQHHVWTDMRKRLASVHSILGRGSLIPLPTIDVGETSQIKQQAFRVSMSFMVLRTTIFKMKDSWRLHAKKDMHKRLASVHSKVGRGSLIPHHRFTWLESATSRRANDFSKKVLLCPNYDGCDNDVYKKNGKLFLYYDLLSTYVKSGEQRMDNNDYTEQNPLILIFSHFIHTLLNINSYLHHHE